MPKRYTDTTSVLENYNDDSDSDIENEYDVPYEEAFPSDNIYIPDSDEEWELRPRIDLEEERINKYNQHRHILHPVKCNERTKQSLWTKIYIKDGKVVMKDFIKKHRKRKYLGTYQNEWIELVRKNKEYFILWKDLKLRIKTKTNEVAIKLITNKLNGETPQKRKTPKKNKKKNCKKKRRKKKY